MTSFTAIPLTDITNFLITNNQSISTNFIDNYLNAFNLMKYVSTVPSSIADWFIAFDLINQPIPIYKTSTILFSSETQLTSLAQSLTLPSVDKERIIRILSYLHKLDPDMSIIDTLPNDILKQILIELDCESILLICKISNKMRSFCDNELKSILQENLTRTTKLILRDYDLEDLLRLCKNQTNKNNIAASHHTLLLTSNHQVYVFGANSTDGRLGLGDNARDENTPIFLDDLPNGIQVACGSAHSLILIANGQVYGFGANQNGNLGLGNNVTVVMPTAITNLRNIGQITCGYSHSLALTNTGKVYAFGSNFVGELGLGDNINKNTPTLIDNLDNIVQISAGVNHSLILTNTGNVYAFGDNEKGQLGLGIFVDGTNIPILISNISNIIQVKCGFYHSLLLTFDGHVYSFGENDFGKLGLGNINDIFQPELISTLTDIIQVAAGSSHSLALNIYGQVYSFGYNNYGRLGLGDINDRYTPTLILDLHKIIQVACGWSSSFALSSNGEVYAFGKNNHGQLGLGDYDNRVVPTVIPNINLL